MSDELVRNYYSDGTIEKLAGCYGTCLGTICNSNWTEWSTIQGVIAQVISKREARVRFEITSTITP